MKNILYLFSIAFGLFVFISCDDDTTNPYAHTTEITVVESDVYFPAKASTGTITFEAEGTVSAKTNTDWCSASVSGSTVTVSVTDNASIQNRSAHVTLYSGNDSTNVPVTQAGVLVALGAGTEIVANSNDAQKMAYSFSTNANFSITSAPDWVTVSTTSDSIYISMTQNNTGHLRSGYIYYETPGLNDSIKVFQAEPTDIEGTYYFAGYNTSTGKLTYLTSTVTYDNGNLTIAFPSMEWTMDVPLETSSAWYFDLPAGTYLGTYSTYQTFITLWDTDAGYLSWSSSVSYRCSFYYDEEAETTIAEFEDNGSWSGYEISAIRFEAFSSTTLSSNTRKGSLFSIMYPFMQKAD